MDLFDLIEVVAEPVPLVANAVLSHPSLELGQEHERHEATEDMALDRVVSSRW